MTASSPRILIVDDDPIVAESLAEFLTEHGYDTAAAHSGAEALTAIDDARSGVGGTPRPFAVLICDMNMPEMDGLELLRRTGDRFPELVSIAITGYGTIETAVKAIRYGALDYLTKPLVDDELRLTVEKAIRQQALLQENTNLRRQLDQRYGFDSIIGSDRRLRHIYDVIESVASSKTTVLIRGESGTGKSLIARAIHHHSTRASKPFVEISCGSIPETLLESELFGHIKGAFTGAHADKPGRFLAAHEGTLFLDEINEASPGMQLKLLRVLQERVFEPVGSNDAVEVDVRVVLATNQPLEQLVTQGSFRQDLYYRINVVNMNLPPLRDRISDIPALAAHFLEMKAREVGKQVMGFDEQVMTALQAYSYPGNVRELENLMERAVVLTRGTRITMDDLPPQVIDNVPGPTASTFPDHSPLSGEHGLMPLRLALQEPEKQIIIAALQANAWNRQKTADQLEINRTTLYKKIKQYGLEEYGQAG
jgi:DNA-binding NtrC family response regulator